MAPLREVVRSIRVVGRMAVLFLAAASGLVRRPLRWRLLVEQTIRVGVESLPIVTVAGAFVGMGLAFNTAHNIRKFGAEIYVGGIVALAVARELGPVMTALMVAGRTGAGIAAEIGTMRVNEQIDALEALGVDPVRYLATPRLAAIVLCLPVLTIYADFIAYLGAYLIGVYRLNLPPALFLDRTAWLVEPADILSGVAKSVPFGAIVATVGCYMGLHTRLGAEGVGRSTTVAVVSSGLLILTANYFLTALLFLLS